MNAAVHTVIRATLHYNMEPWGIYRGFHGLIRGELEPLGSRSVSGIIQRGGTILKSARSEEFKTEAGQAKALKVLAENKIDSLVVIGGDGSFAGGLKLAEAGVDVICIPATIDNDIACTDYCIGFDTAANNVLDAINKIRDTASSHDRVYVLEVMGRHSGFIALYSGLAGGADVILIPEVPYDVDQVCEQIRRANEVGKTYNIVVVAEGVKPVAGSASGSPSLEIGRYIAKTTGYDTRITILGHIQRGGAPTVRDSLLASRLAYHAVGLIAEGQTSKMLGEINQVVRPFDLASALAQKKQLSLDYYHLSNILSSI